MTDYLNDGWFSGFADGEASFILAKKRQARRVGGVVQENVVIGVQPWLQVGLRADDVAVLRELQTAFGGSLSFDGRMSDGNRQPRYIWCVAGKADLARLLDYFDRHPLRAKKKNDYAVWAEATRIYLSRGARAPELWELRDLLSEARKYDGAPHVVEQEA